MNRAFFFDRDGVINKSFIINGKPHAPLTFDKFEIYKEFDNLVKILSKNFYIFVITNQPNVGHGSLKQSELDRMHDFLMSNYPIKKIYVCPHVQKQGCNCRKPKIGNIKLAIQEFNLDIHNSFLVGDRWQDVECGNNAGVKKVFFIDRGYNESSSNNNNNFVLVNNILDILDYI